MSKGDDTRAERLKAALRDNLRRRKAQGRSRTAPPGAEAGEEHAAESPPAPRRES